jgi:hypothetical protein
MRNRALYILIVLSLFSNIARSQKIASFSPVRASTGMTVTITGTGFTNVTAVTFGGTAVASFTVVSSTTINAVVGTGTSGTVQVITTKGSAISPGFSFTTTSAIFSDFGGYWLSSMTSVNAIKPDNSHNLLGFTYNGITYSTGVNNSALSSNGVNFTAGEFHALPVAGITGINSGSTPTYLSLAKKVDGSATIANTPAVANYTIKSVLVDGKNGLDLGTGVTNLPTSAILDFKINNINPTKINDNEPDIILTQTAQPEAGNDEFSFVDASGTLVGKVIMQDMTLLPNFGSYDLDLFNLTPGVPFNTATAYNSQAVATNREIRLVAFKLADFGITTANVGQIKALKVKPSGNSDYAFIAYNASSINLTPNVSQHTVRTNTSLCAGGTAHMAVIASPSAGGTLSYRWEESTNGGSTWTTVTDGGKYAGATTDILAVNDPVNGYQYRAIVTETGITSPGISPVFTISIITAPAAPASVSIAASATSVCLNSPAQLTSTVTGGSNLYYQWQSNVSGSFQDIPWANLDRLSPTINQTGGISYKLRVSSGSGCTPEVFSAPITIQITGIASVTPASRCESGSVTLAATATSGTISWYSTDEGGTALFTGNSYTIPGLSTTTTYYAATSGCASALRVPVTATIYPPSVGGTVDGSTEVSKGTNSTVLTLRGATGTIRKWQASTDGFNISITDIANTTNQLTVTNITQTTQYRTVVKCGDCSEAYSSPATISVFDVLPISSGSVKAFVKGNNILVQWTAYSQENTQAFEIEKSTDGRDFRKVHTEIPSGTGVTKYQWEDNQPALGKNYYRIKEVYISGSIEYTRVVSAEFETTGIKVKVYPNPIVNGKASLQFDDVPAGIYQVRFISNSGQVMYEKMLVHNASFYAHELLLPKHIGGGYFRIFITSKEGFRKSLPVFID